LVLALLGVGGMLFLCLPCCGVGVGSFLLTRHPNADRQPNFIPVLQAPGPAANLPAVPVPRDFGPPVKLVPDGIVEYPPAMPSPHPDERVCKGDFEQGLKGFRSAYRHAPEGLRDEFMFAIVRNPRDVHDSAAAFGDHTSGHGLLMAVNGADAVDRLLWGQSVAVRPGARYTFSLWLASWFPLAPAELEVRFNARVLGRITAPPQVGVWKQFQAAWDAGPANQATIEIVNLTRDFQGNDFAIDDISLRGPPPELQGKK
jgi:hypothetical protein